MKLHRLNTKSYTHSSSSLVTHLNNQYHFWFLLIFCLKFLIESYAFLSFLTVSILFQAISVFALTASLFLTRSLIDSLLSMEQAVHKSTISFYSKKFPATSSMVSGWSWMKESLPSFWISLLFTFTFFCLFCVCLLTIPEVGHMNVYPQTSVLFVPSICHTLSSNKPHLLPPSVAFHFLWKTLLTKTHFQLVRFVSKACLTASQSIYLFHKNKLKETWSFMSFWIFFCGSCSTCDYKI